jgi:hypothetical protein
MGQAAEYQAHKLSQEVKRLTAENERLRAALRAILDSQTFDTSSLDSDLYHVIPDSVLDAAAQALEATQPE